MIGLKRTVLTLSALVFWTAPGWTGTIAGNVADYNAAEVRLSNGVLTVPAGVATYTATSTLAIGSSFTVTLPSGFTFGSAPTLTSSGTSTFTLSSGGVGSQSATFAVATSAVTSGQTISLATFTLDGATALETVTPVASALALTMQAIGSDAAPLSFKAFASDVGAAAVFVGAIQFIDQTAPSNGTEFGTGGTNDSLTAVFSAIAISRQVTDAATNTVPILGSNGSANTLLSTDTATVTIPGNFGGIAAAFSSTTSNCLNPVSNGTVYGTSISIPNVAINTGVFFCVTGSGARIQNNPNGFPTVLITPGTSTDFLADPPVQNEFGGLWVCYPTGCPAYTSAPVPTLSEWSMIGLAGIIVLFGAWKLRARPTTP